MIIDMKSLYVFCYVAQSPRFQGCRAAELDWPPKSRLSFGSLSELQRSLQRLRSGCPKASAKNWFQTLEIRFQTQFEALHGTKG